METISIALMCTVLGSIIGFFTFQRNRTNDIKANTRDEAEMRAKLDYISKGVDDIRIDKKSQDREINSLAERMTRNEESVKSAHKRIDSLEGDH